MPHRALLAVLWLTLAGSLAAVPATQPDPQAAALAKYWADQLATLNRQLGGRGPSTPPTTQGDRPGLWLAKAEALIQTGQYLPAAGAFEHAAAEPAVAPDVADHALAMALLVRRCDWRGYHAAATRQNPEPPAFDIKDPTARPAALAALLATESDVLAARVDKAKAATDQATVVGLLKAVAVLRPLDRTVNHSADKTDAVAQTVATHFTDTVVHWAATTTDRMAALRSLAQEPVDETPLEGMRGHSRMLHGAVDEGWRQRGVKQGEQAEARDAVRECQRLAGVYQALQPLLTPDARKTLEPIKANVQGACDNANDLLVQATRPTRDNLNNPPN